MKNSDNSFNSFGEEQSKYNVLNKVIAQNSKSLSLKKGLQHCFPISKTLKTKLYQRTLNLN